MKLYKKSTIGLLMALICGGAFVGCTEEATLDGADKVYITMNPTDITLRMGDTVRISAVVENLSGKTIDTPIQWSVQDESVAKLLGDSAVVCQPGAQGKSTRLKAALENGQYGLANISVVTHLPEGVCAVDTAGNVIASYRSYASAGDSVIFAVTPKELLEDFVPTYTAEGVTLLDEALTIDKEKGRFAIHFSSPRESGTAKISVAIGEASTEKKASCDILLQPQVFATFYGENYPGMPYIDGGHPDKSTLPMYFAYLYETNMDVNSEATVRVAINVQTGAKEDIEAAYGAYRWELESGSSVIISGMTTEYFPDNGFDAILSVRSGIEKGETTFRCITPDTVLTAVFKVEDFKNDYPVDEITVDRSTLEMMAGEVTHLRTGVIPEKSFKYHKPVVTVADPSIAKVGTYNGNEIPVEAIAVGSTELILTANGKELRVPLTVTENIENVAWTEGNIPALFEGQSTEWDVNVLTSTGGPNPYAVEWQSSDNGIVTVAAAEGNKGVVTAVAEGTADIIAKVKNKATTPATVTVVAATDRILDKADVGSSSSIYLSEDEEDLELNVIMNSGLTIKVLALGVGNKSDYNATYSDNLYVSINNATAPATGTMTVAEGDGETLTVSLNLTVTVGAKSFVVKADGIRVTNWL